MNSSALQRFHAKIDRRPDGCWLWTGATDPNGYGRFHIEGRMIGAHRAAYLLLRGPIKYGHDLDHLCRVRNCVNPAHLEPVTRRENLLRGDTLTAAHAAGRDCGFDACPNCKRHRTAEAA